MYSFFTMVIYSPLISCLLAFYDAKIDNDSIVLLCHFNKNNTDILYYIKLLQTAGGMPNNVAEPV